jgi:hypothetical protein
MIQHTVFYSTLTLPISNENYLFFTTIIFSMENKDISFNLIHFQNILVSCFHGDPAWEELCAILNLILDVTMTFDTNSHKDQQIIKDNCPLTAGGFMWKYLLDLVNNEKNSQPAALSLAVSGLVVKSSLAQQQRCVSHILLV